MKGFAKMVWDFAEALKKHGNDGWKTQSCGLCGCHMPVKARWRTTQCADNPPKWLATNGSKRKEGADTDPSD